MRRLLTSSAFVLAAFVSAGARGETGSTDLQPGPDRWGVVLSDGREVHPGHWWNPYGPNVLKGDRPILGDHTYFVWTTVLDGRGTGFAPGAGGTRALGFENLVIAAEMFHGETVFRPKDWSIRMTAVSAVTRDSSIRTPSPQKFLGGENFAEVLLATYGGESYDSASLRAGVQNFNADVEGLVLNDALPAARAFAEYRFNRYDFNVFYGRPFDKADPAFLPKTLQADVGVASLFVGDAFRPGLNVLATLAFDADRRTKGKDEHVGYLSLGSTGHVGRVVTQSSLYVAAGTDEVAGESHTVLAPMLVADVALPVNAWNWRATLLYAPGDSNPGDKTETAYDAIADKELFAGADGSGILGGFVGGAAANVVLVPQADTSTKPFVLFRQGSILPTLRGANAAPNFTNGGERLVDLGLDLTVTPRLVLSGDAATFFWDQPKTLQTITGAVKMDSFAGQELIGQIRWRPALNDNAIVALSSALLLPGAGLKDLGAPDGAQLKGDLRVILAF